MARPLFAQHPFGDGGGERAARVDHRGRVALLHLHGTAHRLPLHALGELLHPAHGGRGPREGAEEGEVALRDAARLEAAQQLLDGREKLGVVGRAADDERVVAEDVAQHDRRIGVGEVVDPDPPHARLGQLPGDAFGHLFRVAVHRTVGHDRARFAFVAAQTVVQIYHAGNLALPDGAVRRADGPDRKPADLLQRLLHGDAVFAHYAGVVAAHLVPVAFRFEGIAEYNQEPE